MEIQEQLDAVTAELNELKTSYSNLQNEYEGVRAYNAALESERQALINLNTRYLHIIENMSANR